MHLRHYRLLPAIAASVSLLAAGLTAGCGSDRAEKADPVTGKVAAQYRDLPGIVQCLRGARRRGVGPFGDGASAGESGEFRDRTESPLSKTSSSPRKRAPSGVKRNRRCGWAFAWSRGSPKPAAKS